MNYVLLALVASILWAIVNIIDKHVTSKYISEPFVPVIVIGAVGFLISSVILLFEGWPVVGYKTLILGLSCGILYLLAALFYIKALLLDDVSKLVPIFFISPLFVLPASIYFLGESYSYLSITGISLLMIGAIGLTLDDKLKINFNLALLYIVLSTLCSPLVLLMTKYILAEMNAAQAMAITRMGFAIGIMPFLFLKWKDLSQLVRNYGIKPFILMGTNQILNMIGVLLVTYALTLGKVTVVNSLGSMQPLFVLMLSAIISLFIPTIGIEKLSKETIRRRCIFIIVLVLGSILVGL